MACFKIMAIIVDNRTKEYQNIQKVLTENGCIIKVRLGLHETGNVCSEEGLIILQLDGSKQEISKLESELNAVEGVKSKIIELCS